MGTNVAGDKFVAVKADIFKKLPINSWSSTGILFSKKLPPVCSAPFINSRAFLKAVAPIINAMGTSVVVVRVLIPIYFKYKSKTLLSEIFFTNSLIELPPYWGISCFDEVSFSYSCTINLAVNISEVVLIYIYYIYYFEIN